MTIRLSYKLVGAFFLILAIAVGAMGLSRYLFSLNFKTYFNQVAEERLQGLVPVLQEAYRTTHSWASVTNDPQRWQRLLSEALDIRKHTPPPPAGAISPGSPDTYGRPPGPPPDGMPGPPAMILLMDAQERSLLGHPSPDDPRRLVAIEVDGQVVGWLGWHHHEPFKSGPPAALLARQTRQFYLLGTGVIGLTALIAFLFSRHLLGPIQRLARVTRELTQRNFTVRIAATTSDEIGELTNHFNAMAHTLESYEQMRRQWITDIAHELRTPLSVLRGEIEAIQDGIREPTPQNLTSLHAEILRLGKLVDDLHLLARSDSDQLQIEWLRVAPFSVLKNVTETYRDRFVRKGIQLEVVPAPGMDKASIRGDGDRLAQVFTNLLDNALKYVATPGKLAITGAADQQTLTLLFQDSGPGVPAEALPRLFDRLFRVDPSRSRETGGSGLGLSICRNIIDRHQGRIWAEPGILGGLTIGISLPRWPQ
ncbi:Signal transduction histidine kinase [Desulfosarcina cetonica]|uniref:ATP-binding protein n=1 Tax=Desulfosarcina cetonica TaxID=90730 RepID=UPI0006CFAC81|nr:ATP-binding protein [Desulfosarcina cetonica]VTR67753.1 Signal transduction histidine kinase [Desulfosarcina cetonica]